VHKNIIVVEGTNDLFFLREIALNVLSLNPQDCSIFSEIRHFQRAVSCKDQKYLSLICGGGSNLVKSTLIISRQFWNLNTEIVIGVMADSDTGCIYTKLKEGFSEYIKNKNRVPVLTPTLETNDEEKTFLLKPKFDRIIPFWTTEIPNSLEWQIEKVLKIKYPNIDNNLNDDETIKSACAISGNTREEVISNCVVVVSNKKWFKNLLNRLNKFL
jgi:hypothetical protein